jgi:ubiquinone biosynthesis protein
MMGVLGQVLVAILIAVATTLLSLRLLGTRRGWGTALVAALIGWGLALVVAVGVNGWDWDVEGLVLHLLAIGIPATMATAVTIDLLARPGSLALGERAGLLVTPRPVHAVRRRVSVLRRYRELLRLCRKEGFGPFLSAERAERSVDAPGVRLPRVLEQAAGVHVKLGQIAATRVDLLPPEVCDELAELQNRVPPDPQDCILSVLEADLGVPVDEVFAEFDWEPLAAASIGQTYRAHLRSGDAVVVKVQRPDIGALIERDLAALALLADFAQRRTPFGQGVHAGEMLGQFADGLRVEVDFRPEADAMSEMAGMLDGDVHVRVPRVCRQVSGPRVLVQECFEGVTITELRRMDGDQPDRKALADHLLRATLDQVMRIGLFHADPHPGNVFAVPDGSLGLIDWGVPSVVSTRSSSRRSSTCCWRCRGATSACCATAWSGSPSSPT